MMDATNIPGRHNPRHGAQADLALPRRIRKEVAPRPYCTECEEFLTWDARQECYVDRWGQDVCPDENGTYWAHSHIEVTE